MMRARLGAALAGLLALCAPASAHQSSVVYLDFAVAGRRLDATVRLGSGDLGELTGEREVTPAGARASQAKIVRYVTERLHVSSGGTPCTPSLEAVTMLPRTAGFFVSIALAYACDRTIERASIDYRIFFELDPRHQAFAKLTAPGTTQSFLFHRGAERWEVAISGTTLHQVGTYLPLGVEHIFTGYDHLLFLLGLLLVACVGNGQPRPLGDALRYTLAIVTAFTLAHSLTLGASALGWASLPSRWVESAIALSVAYVGIENLLARQPRRRALLGFGFGLVHGFGFASVLGEIGLPETGLLASLAAFNVGVELGQLAVVAILFPLLYLLARRAPRRYVTWVIRPVSGLIVIAGLLWFVERAF